MSQLELGNRNAERRIKERQYFYHGRTRNNTENGEYKGMDPILKSFN